MKIRIKQPLVLAALAATTAGLWSAPASASPVDSVQPTGVWRSITAASAVPADPITSCGPKQFVRNLYVEPWRTTFIGWVGAHDAVGGTGAFLDKRWRDRLLKQTCRVYFRGTLLRSYTKWYRHYGEDTGRHTCFISLWTGKAKPCSTIKYTWKQVPPGLVTYKPR